MTLVMLWTMVPSELAAAADDHPQRAEAQRLFAHLGLHPGQSIADLGTNTANLAAAMAELLGPHGRVFVSELTAPRLDRVRLELANRRIANIQVMSKDLSQAASLPAGCCDAIYMREVYHHLPDPVALASTLMAALKPGGRLAIIDFSVRPLSRPPEGAAPARRGHGVFAADVIEEMRLAGLELIPPVSLWPTIDGSPTGMFVAVFRPRQAEH